MASAEYQKRQEGNQWVFDVTPASPPKSLWFAVLGGVCVLFGLMAGPFGWIILLPAGAFSIWLGQFRDGRPAPHRSPSRFTVSPNAIEANGRAFPKDDIHRLIIKNGISNDVIPNIMFQVNTSTAMGAIHRVNVSKVANSLEVETGGKAYLLAGGMDQTTAFGLLHDVSKVLRFETAQQAAAAG